MVITEATIKDALCLDDAEGVNCLPNEEIFAELASMGYEKPSTKLTFYKAFFSSYSAMASAVICLSTGDVVHEPSITSPTLSTPPPQQSQDLPSTSQVQHTPPQSPLLQLQPSPPAQPQAADFPMSLLQEVLDACAALTRRVEHL
nr:hypothetical protein [Tanacetum cinerariifolium]